ncbi:MAG TPA: NAD-dependent epimerase/dehydratase family protein [Steroidobacteraceae bacterium]|nr:NAD-dependent epimerase/dehydratase family protein [Steroidobacteraceae bacterium]
MDRRKFVHGAAALAAFATATRFTGAHGAAAGRAARPLRILILGGTRFIGVHMTQFAIDRGHTVTLFNRGRTNADLFPNVEHLHGDRDNQLDSLRGRKWDAVIDTSGYVPRHVRLSAQLLAPNIRQYLFISSISVYASLAQPATEDSPVGTIPDETVEDIGGGNYGPLKALCEKAALAALPGRTTVFRPGLIVGPEDNSDRFTYWPARAARGGEILAPGSPADPIQVIDVRDLAAFTVHALEQRTLGTFNVDSPPGRFSMGDLLAASIAAANELARPASPPRAVWVPGDFLEKEKVAPWSDMPVWLPPEGETAGAAKTSVARALKAGLTNRPLAQTVHDTLAWHLARPEAEREKLKAGIATDREQQVLAAWHELKA